MTVDVPATFKLGGELEINRLGFGAMRLTGQPNNYGPAADWEGAKALLRRAVELGVQFIDTARAYGPGWNEALIAEALQPFPANLIVATKGGIDRGGPEASQVRIDGRPETLAAQIEESREKLKVERIGLYYLHWPDPNTPFERQVEALARARSDGKIRFIGLSNVTAEQLDAACRIAPIAAVQNRYNVADEGDVAMVEKTRKLGIAYVPWSPLGASPMEAGAPLAAAGGAQTSLRGLLERSPNIVPIPGTTRRAHLEENMAAWRSLVR